MPALGLLVLLALTHAQTAWAELPVFSAQGARCGFLVDCSQFEQVGIHLVTGAALARDLRGSQLAAQGAVRLSLTLGEVAEGGAALAGQLDSEGGGSLRFIASPLSLFARVRLLPLKLGPLAMAPLRLALTYQHDLVAQPLGTQTPPGFSLGTLRVIAGRSIGPVDLDGSAGFVLAQRGEPPPRPLAFELGAAATLWLRRPNPAAPRPELRLTGEALYRFSLDPGLKAQGSLLLGFLGMTASGYGGGLAAGLQLDGNQAGFVAVLRLQASWGKSRHNPWAERKAAEPQTTPAFIWMLLGAIDPVLGSDGCVYTDATPERPSTRWFCIGTPAPDDPSQIVLPCGKRVPVGAHLWQLGASLRLDDGSKVVEIPLTARLRKAVWDFFDEQLRMRREDQATLAQHVSNLCAGKFSVRHGADAGTAAMVSLDELGGPAGVLSDELMHAAYCTEAASTPEQVLTTLSVLSALRSRGPLRARPPSGLGEAAEQPPPKGKAGSGAAGGSVAEHVAPPHLSPPLTPAARNHIYSGDVSKGKSTGWHYEPTGDRAQDTYVLAPTRSAPDSHGVYEANVVIQGVKKNARSSFFPAHWTQEEVERAIEEAYQSRVQILGEEQRFVGTTKGGVQIELRLLKNGSIQTAYPIYDKK